MALTAYQVVVLRLLAERRRREGVSYVAGGAALNVLLRESRRSRDVDLFHDTTDALLRSWEADASELRAAGHSVEVLREVPSFVEAVVRRGADSVLMQWVRDSAFRFFPVREDELLGLTLHEFDLATNKILAAAGRLEPRDWVDTLACHRSVQSLGYLVWAACGKDPGVNPDMLFDQLGRLRYVQDEIEQLDFEQAAPSASSLSVEWKRALTDGKEIVAALPEEHLGECVLRADGRTLFGGNPRACSDALREGAVRFHQGSIGGVWPRIADMPR
jgi:hypothetical protein